MQALSGPPSSRASTVVIAVALVLALIGVGGIATGAADKPDDDERVASTGTTTTTGVDETTTTVAGAVGATTTVAGGSTGTTARSTGTTGKSSGPGTVGAGPCAAPPAASADPGPHQPPAVGTYTFASCEDDDDTDDEKITAGPTGGGVTRRNISDDTSGFPQTATVSWGPSGVLLESLTISSPQGSLSCDFQPDVLNYPATLTVGTQWNADSSCDLKQQGNPTPVGKITIKGTGKVTGKVAVTVSNTTVNAWVVEGDLNLTFEVTGFGSGTTNIKSKDYYDPSRGIDLYRRAESKDEDGTETFEQRLVSLTPKP